MNDKFSFLKQNAPFSSLSDNVLEGIAAVLQEINYQKDTLILRQELTKMKGVEIIVTGEFESFFYDATNQKRAIEFHNSGYCYGGISVLLNRKKSLKTVIAKNGTLTYFLPRKDFKSLCNAYEHFYQYFTTDFANRMLDEEFAHFYRKPASFEESYIASEQLYSRKIEQLSFRNLVSCEVNTPIYEAAQKMAIQKVSCLFVKNLESKIIGFVTDITLRDNVIAKQLSPQESIETVMDRNLVSITKNAYIYEALLMMYSTKTRYLLVSDDGKDVGFLSRNRLLSEQAQSPLVFIQSVKSSNSVKELKNKWEQVPQIVAQLLGRGVNAEIVNQVLTTIADTISQKVIEEVINEVGPAPAKFVFVVLGSEGRKELTLKTDQDNAIIYEDKANEQRELVRAYFLVFATKISDKLNEIGFVYCTGGYMAQNPKWTHSLSHWKNNYKEWIEDALPETTIKFSTFFDCRVIYGETSIIDELRIFVDQELQQPMEKFFVYMAKNALQYEPPLTFFKNIRTEKIEEKEVFDIKKAMTPIVDLVRVYALQNRIFRKENTGERLKALRDIGVFTNAQFQELMQSYYYLMSLRLRNQAQNIIRDRKAPDNYISLDSLTKIEQVTLKEIFKTIENFQLGIKMKFTNSLT
jgi:CBS domain-containing protein